MSCMAYVHEVQEANDKSKFHREIKTCKGDYSPTGHCIDSVAWLGERKVILPVKLGLTFLTTFIRGLSRGKRLIQE